MEIRKWKMKQLLEDASLTTSGLVFDTTVAVKRMLIQAQRHWQLILDENGAAIISIINSGKIALLLLCYLFGSAYNLSVWDLQLSDNQTQKIKAIWTSQMLLNIRACVRVRARACTYYLNRQTSRVWRSSILLSYSLALSLSLSCFRSE